MTSSPSFTFYFIVEPPSYEVLACYLAASLRVQFGADVQLVGYCPKAKIPDLNPEVRQLLDKLQVDLRGFATEGRFDPAYPHGNKILATLEKRDTDYACFLDSDILCLRPNRIENLLKPGHVSLSKAASLNWAPQSMWDRVYATAGMEPPTERFKLMKQKRGEPKMPYFSSGLFCFPETHRNTEGKTFPEVWMEMAELLDRDPEIPSRRPYLDQISMPLAIRKAGLAWNILPDTQHFILGGKARGEPLPEDLEIFTVHYRNWPILKEVGLAGQAKQMLQAMTGVKKLGSAKVKPTSE